MRDVARPASSDPGAAGRFCARVRQAGVAIGALAGLLPGDPAPAQPVTTIVTHGYATSTVKAPWIEAMAEAIVARAVVEGASGGTVCRYDEASGAWRLVSGSLEPGEPIVLIFRWLEDFAKSGPDWGFAEGAADALHAALRDARFVDAAGKPLAAFDLVAKRHLHFLGHSRGSCVNSEVVERLAVEGIVVDHVTTMDPHPVNGTLDSPFNPNWGDPVPRTWSNVTFADNYWRADGGGLINGLDFDGIFMPGALDQPLSESALNCCAYSFAHSDVHLWYHGTIDHQPAACDGEQCFNTTMRSTWYAEGYAERGFYYARLGGGAARRPAAAAGIAPGPVPSLYGGSFDQASFAGWLYHGGSSAPGSIVNEGGRTYLRVGAGSAPVATHNRFLLAAEARRVELSYRVLTPDSAGDDELSLTLLDPDGGAWPLGGAIMLGGGATGWITGHTMVIPNNVPRSAAYRLAIEVAGGAAIQGTIGVDDVVIVTGPAADLDGDGDVDVADLLALLAAWGLCPEPCPAPGECAADLSSDCAVSVADLLVLLAAWG